MPLVSMRELLDHAAENGYGIPAFNVNNLEQVQAVMAAADEVGAPVILQASAGARKYAGESFIKHLIQAACEALQREGFELVSSRDAATIAEGFLERKDFGTAQRIYAILAEKQDEALSELSQSRANWESVCAIFDRFKKRGTADSLNPVLTGSPSAPTPIDI